ncbi:MAG: hypothetical protein GX638_15370, partial [Crenarchaeota archaeon]|nr:hypothetical protein [Thermoproteota archaeon]
MLSLTFSFPTPLLGIKTAEAINVAVQWGYVLNSTDILYEENICDYIYDLFDGVSWSASNAYWTYTTETNLGQVLQWENSRFNGVGYATNWWIGDYHGDSGLNPTPAPYGHLYCYGASSDDIRDAEVNTYATWRYDSQYGWDQIPSKQYFNFIWTCVNGGVYWNDPSGSYDNVLGIVYPDPNYSPPPSSPPPIPTNTNDEYGFVHYTGVVGMPLAWTDDPDLSLDGFNSPNGDYCYIGFESKSPFMGDIAPGYGYYYQAFPAAFYAYALGYIDDVHHTINES